MAFTDLSGYLLLAWDAIYGTLTYTTANLSTTDASASILLATASADTMQNGVDAINAYNLSVGFTDAYNALEPVLTLPLGLTPAQLSFVTNRISAIQAAAASLLTLPPTPASVVATPLSIGKPAIAYVGLLEWMMGFDFEAIPSGLSAANFVVQAAAQASAWVAVSTALQTQPVTYTGATLNAVNTMAAVSQLVAENLATIGISTEANLSTTWNTIVALPACSKYSSSVTNDPTSNVSQQTNVVLYIAGSSLYNLNILLVNLADQVPSQVSLATIQQSDRSLMDVAARTLGNFEQWTSIATLNGLQPPYISATPGPNVATIGQQIYIPTTQSVTAPSVAVPSYTLNYLGIDIYYGPLNSVMNAWTGDFGTISGYQNLAFSLGRRLQTTLGTMMYHSTFGSRIPPEVGNILTEATSGYISAYASSAILSDPRVDQIISLTTTFQGVYSISVAAEVQPNGFGSASFAVNQVIQSG